MRNDEEYRAALQLVEELWGAALGSPEGDLLDRLITCAEAYERERFPID